MKAVECRNGIVITNGFRTVAEMEKEKQKEKILITDDWQTPNTTLITGITGFVGSHLVDYIRDKQKHIVIHGIVRWRSVTKGFARMDGVYLHYGDLNDISSLRTIITEVKPDIIFHLAAQSYVDMSFVAPADTLKKNVVGTCNLFEVVKELKKAHGYDPVIHVCSSSEVYGQVKQNELPIRETNQFRPASPYAVSKVGVDMLALQYYLSWGLQTIRTRSFTHTGPGRGEVFALSSFAKQIADIEKGKQTPILNVGNLNSVRTLCDVRDMVRAYWMLPTYCKAGEVYNIGGNKTMTIGEALDILLSFTKKDIQIEVAEGRIRPSDVTLQVPNIEKFQDATGWEPEYEIGQTLKDMLNYWRKQE